MADMTVIEVDISIKVRFIKYKEHRSESWTVLSPINQGGFELASVHTDYTISQYAYIQ